MSQTPSHWMHAIRSAGPKPALKMRKQNVPNQMCASDGPVWQPLNSLKAETLLVFKTSHGS